MKRFSVSTLFKVGLGLIPFSKSYRRSTSKPPLRLTTHAHKSPLFLLILLMLGSPMPYCQSPKISLLSDAPISGAEKALQDERPPLVKAAAPSAFVHFMVGFKTPEFSGVWSGWDFPSGWSYADTPFAKHNIHRRDEQGRIDIASVYYPAIGPYDQNDPALAEYHAQLLKLAGLDGGFFDVAYFREPTSKDPNERPTPMVHYVEQFARYGLKAAIIYEDKCHWLWNRTLSNRDQAVAASYADLNGFMKLLEPVQYCISGRPLIGFYSYEVQKPGRGISRLSPSELARWKSNFPPERQPLLVTQWYKNEFRGVIDGRFDWIGVNWGPAHGIFQSYARLSNVMAWYEHGEAEVLGFFKQKENYLFHIAGVTPGFDDRGVYGWGKGNRVLDREEGAVYAYTWEKALRWKSAVVQVATWNDFYEGTVIEPTVEHGTRYLEATRKYVAALHGTTPSRANLTLPEHLYRARKRFKAASAQLALSNACELIRQGKLEQAEAIVKPYAKPLLAERYRPLEIPDRWLKGWALDWDLTHVNPASGPLFFTDPGTTPIAALMPAPATNVLFFSPRNAENPATLRRAFRVSASGGKIRWRFAPAGLAGKASAVHIRLKVNTETLVEHRLGSTGAKGETGLSNVELNLDRWKGEEILVSAQALPIAETPCGGVLFFQPEFAGLTPITPIPSRFLPKPILTWEKAWTIANGTKVVYKNDFGLSGDRPPQGRKYILQVHPLDAQTPCVLSRTVTPRPGSKLVFAVAANIEQALRADFQLFVRVQGTEQLRKVISAEAGDRPEAWSDFSIDLSPWAGKPVLLELENAAGGKNLWAFEFGYFSAVEVTGLSDETNGDPAPSTKPK